MALDPCEPCECPSVWARSEESFMHAVILLLCTQVSQQAALQGEANNQNIAVDQDDPTTLLSATPTRMPGSIVVNPAGSGAVLWILEGGGTPATGTGFPLAAGQTYNIVTTGAVKAYQNDVATVSVFVSEILPA